MQFALLEALLRITICAKEMSFPAGQDMMYGKHRHHQNIVLIEDDLQQTGNSKSFEISGKLATNGKKKTLQPLRLQGFADKVIISWRAINKVQYD